MLLLWAVISSSFCRDKVLGNVNFFPVFGHVRKYWWNLEGDCENVVDQFEGYLIEKLINWLMFGQNF